MVFIVNLEEAEVPAVFRNGGSCPLVLIRCFSAARRDLEGNLFSVRGLGYAFRCVVTDADGNSVTSNSAAFFVKTEELRITKQPMSVEAAPRDIAEFRASAAGGRPPYRYQWEVSDDTMGWTWIDTLQDTSMYYDDAKGLLQVEISGYEWRDHVRYRCVVFDADGRSIQTQPVEISEKVMSLRV